MKLLQCQGLNKSFGGIEGLKDITIDFLSSHITAIIGPNGAGKTTLLNVITGHLLCDSGRCTLSGIDLIGRRPCEIAQRGIARTFQDNRLIREVSCLDNVMLGMPRQIGEKLWRSIFRWGVRKQESANRDKALRLLGLVGLAGVADRPAKELSYGQQKLLSLVSCIATGASVLLLDEPVAGVHATVAAVIQSTLQELRSAGKTLVFIEHDLEMVRVLADTVIVMDQGRVIAEGTGSQVLNRPDVLEAFIG